MTCPFLREAQVQYCQTAAFRKLIPLAASPKGAVRAEEKCASESHAACPVFRLQRQEPAACPCPYLRESLMQYCAAAPVARFVPYSESLLSRCGHDGFRYCGLYLQMAHPAASSAETDSVAAPDWLHYSANHMWLDLTEDGACHIGIDAFLSRALGPIEAVGFVWQRGRHLPAAVLTVGGIEVEVMFPNPLLIANCNLYLRAAPSKISAEPYTGGWLFEGTPVEGTLDCLRSGGEARGWMEEEQRRMNQFLQSWPRPGEAPGMCDGGLFAAGVLRQLERDQARALVHEFFSPYASGKREPS